MGPLVRFTWAAASLRVSLAVRKKICSLSISSIILTYAQKLLNSEVQFTCFYHRGQMKVNYHLEFIRGSLFRLHHRAASSWVACQGTEPKSLIGAAEGRKRRRIRRRRRRRKMQWVGQTRLPCLEGTLFWSMLGQCAAPAPHPSPSSMVAVFAHYFFIGRFSVSESNLLARESQTPGE